MTPEQRLEILVRVGEELFGRDWQRPIARFLGPAHPDGARDAIDDSLVRKWVRKARPVPEWVPQALAARLQQRIAQLAKLAADVERSMK